MAHKKSLDIVIPIFNEEVELEKNIFELHTFLTREMTDWRWRIVIADNASIDSSLAIAKRLSEQYCSVAFVYLKEKGRGRAVKKVWKEGDADICVYMDVDLSTDLNSLHPLLHSFSRGYDIAIGSRLLPASTVINRSLQRGLLSIVYNRMIKLFFLTRFSDAQCGFKAVSRKVVRELISEISDDGWFFDSELLIVGEKSGYKINEVPVKWVDNPGSTVRVLPTITGDLSGLCRLFFTKPWKRISAAL